MVRSYRESAAFGTLKSRTKSDYLKVLDWLKGMDDVAIAAIDSPSLAKLRDKAFKLRKRRFANYVLSVMSVVFVHGIEIGIAKGNPAKGIKKIRRPTDAPISNRAWTEAEKLTVLKYAPAHLIAPIAIARWLGLREGDIIRLQKVAYTDGQLNIVTSKRGVPNWFRCPNPLREILDAMPKHSGMTLCVSSRGTPWTEDGFRSSFFKLVRKLEREGLVAPGLTFHGLRTSFAEEARSHGFTNEQIADALAQRDAGSAAHYTKNYDRKKSTREISEALDGTNGGHNLSTKVSTQHFGRPRRAPK
jgi:integrase